MMRLIAAAVLIGLLVAPAFAGPGEAPGNGRVQDEFSTRDCFGTPMDDPRCPIITGVVESNGVSVQFEEQVRIDVRD